MARSSAEAPLLHADVAAKKSVFGAFVEIGRESRVDCSSFSECSCCERCGDVADPQIGRIAAFTCCGATDRPMEQASLHRSTGAVRPLGTVRGGRCGPVR